MTEGNLPGAMPTAEPRDAKWVRALPLVVGGLILFAVLKSCGFVGSGGGLVDGTYGCFTTTITPSTRIARTQDELQQTGQTMVRDIIQPSMLMIPAIFGNIQVDGSSYTLSGSGNGGEYSASGDSLSFTGDLSAMTVRGFEPDNNRFTLVYQDMAFLCSLNR